MIRLQENFQVLKVVSKIYHPKNVFLEIGQAALFLDDLDAGLTRARGVKSLGY